LQDTEILQAPGLAFLPGFLLRRWKFSDAGLKAASTDPAFLRGISGDSAAYCFYRI